jgi:hypothetical protein
MPNGVAAAADNFRDQSPKRSIEAAFVIITAVGDFLRSNVSRPVGRNERLGPGCNGPSALNLRRNMRA